MKLSEFILENVTRIQKEELSRATYQPHYMHFNNRIPSGLCYICVSGYIRALEGRETCELSKQDRILNLCRTGLWWDANSRLGNDEECDELPDPLLLEFIRLPKPLFPEFVGWWQFKQHIESLKERALIIKEIGL